MLLISRFSKPVLPWVGLLSIGGGKENRTLEPFTASGFQDRVFVHASLPPYVPAIGLEPI